MNEYCTSKESQKECRGPHDAFVVSTRMVLKENETGDVFVRCGERMLDDKCYRSATHCKYAEKDESIYDKFMRIYE